MHLCFLISLNLILISCLSGADGFGDNKIDQTDILQGLTSSVPPESSASTFGPESSTSTTTPQASDSSSTNIPDATTSFSTDSTSYFPTGTPSTTTFNPSSDASTAPSDATSTPSEATSATESTNETTSAHPPKNVIKHKKKNIPKKLHFTKKVPDFTDDDSVECKTLKSELTIDYRQQILDSHNEFRSTLANGMAQLPDGTFASPSSNMYKLKYSCKLEKMAQKWANQATLEHNNNREIPSGENIFWLSGVDGLEDDAINGTSNYWWNELKKYGIISGTNVTYLKGMTHAIGHWSQMAWSSTQFIGCGFTKFQKKNEDNIFYYYTVCNYFPSGNVIGMPIYEIGNSCKKDSECTQKSKSICDVDSGLCYS